MSQRESVSVHPSSHPSPPTPTPRQTDDAASLAASKQMSKVLLRTALQRANSAVMCDSNNDVVGAIDAYTEAISLLNRVLSTIEKGSDRRRLQEIHDSYTERIRLLGAMSPAKSDDEPHDELYETFDDYTDKDKSDWLSKPAKRNYSAKRHQQNHDSFLRRMTSESSIDTAVSDSIKEKDTSSASRARWQNTSSSPTAPSSSPTATQHTTNNTAMATISTPTTACSTISATSSIPPAPSPVASQSTPTHSKRQTDDHQTDIPVPDHSSERSVVRQVARNQDGFEVERSLSGSTDSSLTDSLDSLSEQTSTATTATATTATYQPAMTLPPLQKKRVEQASPSSRTSSLPKVRQQHSNPALNQEMRRAQQQTQQPTPVQAPQQQQQQQQQRQSGFGSVRKKSSNRLSRVSLHSDMKRSQSNGSHTMFSSMFSTMPRSASVHQHPFYQQQQQQQQQQNQQSPHQLDSYFGNTNVAGTASLDDRPMRLLLALKKSMEDGAYITPRLYIPKNMWYQPNIRLQHMEVKIAACESLMADLARLSKWKRLDDLTASMRLLETLEEAIESLQTLLARKLKRESMADATPPATTSTSPTKDHYDAGSKKFMSWGSKLSKSVERMNAFSLTKTEDQYRNYIDTLQKVFAQVQIIPTWSQHYTAVKRDAEHLSPACDVALQKLARIGVMMDEVLGGFVVRDLTVLLRKWLKRGSSWVNE